jgi:hypothetical protein
MPIALKTATKLICAALPFAVTLSPAFVPEAVMWGMREHWDARLGHALTTVIAASAEQLPDGLRVGCGMPWGIVAHGVPDLSDDEVEEP